MAVILPNPCAVTLVYVVGLTSPEAVTKDTKLSCLATLAVCTVTTPLLAWFTLKRTIPPSTTATPAPIATLCHVFIRFPFAPPRYGHHSRGLSPREVSWNSRVTKLYGDEPSTSNRPLLVDTPLRA